MGNNSGVVSLPDVPPPPVVDPPWRAGRLRATPIDSTGRPLAPGLDIGDALISTGFTADTEPFPGATLTTDQRRAFSFAVDLTGLTAESYRVLLGHPFGRHDAETVRALGGDPITVAGLRAREFISRYEGRPYTWGRGDCSGFMAAAARTLDPDWVPPKPMSRWARLRMRVRLWWFSG